MGLYRVVSSAEYQGTVLGEYGGTMIISIDKKKKGTKDRALRYPKVDRSGVRGNAVDSNNLGPVREVNDAMT